MDISKKTLLLCMNIFLLSVAFITILMHIGILNMPEIELKDVWMTSNVGLSVAAMAWFNLMYSEK